MKRQNHSAVPPEDLAGLLVSSLAGRDAILSLDDPVARMSTAQVDARRVPGAQTAVAILLALLGALADAAIGAYRKVTSTVGRVVDRLAAPYRRAYHIGRSWGQGTASDDDRAAAGQTATLISIISLGVLISVGILLYSEVSTSLPTPSDTDLADAQNQTDQQFADAMELAPVIMFVLIIGVVIGVIQGL
jgi:hypothetical protein